MNASNSLGASNSNDKKQQQWRQKQEKSRMTALAWPPPTAGMQATAWIKAATRLPANRVWTPAKVYRWICAFLSFFYRIQSAERRRTFLAWLFAARRVVSLAARWSCHWTASQTPSTAPWTRRASSQKELISAGPREPSKLGSNTHRRRRNLRPCLLAAASDCCLCLCSSDTLQIGLILFKYMI